MRGYTAKRIRRQHALICQALGIYGSERRLKRWYNPRRNQISLGHLPSEAERPTKEVV